MNTILLGVKTLVYYETGNYNLFVNTEINRDIYQKHVESLKESIEKYGLIQPLTVITLGKKFHVIDGGQRFEACKQLNKPIKFIIHSITGLNADEIFQLIVELNNKKLSWVNKDYIKSFIAGDNENYKEYKQFQIDFPDFSSNAIGKILEIGGGEFSSTLFKTGRFVTGDIDTAYRCAEDLMKIKAYNHKLFKNVMFIRAFVDIWQDERYNHQVFLHSMQKAKFQTIFLGLHNISRYKEAIYTVYNDKLSEKNKL